MADRSTIVHINNGRNQLSYARPHSGLDTAPGIDLVFPDHSSDDLLSYGKIFPKEFALKVRFLRRAVLRAGERGISHPHRKFLKEFAEDADEWAELKGENDEQIFRQPIRVPFAVIADEFGPMLKADFFNAFATRDEEYARSVVRGAECTGGRVLVYNRASEGASFVKRVLLEDGGEQTKYIEASYKISDNK